jgi:hypothetical protein
MEFRSSRFWVILLASMVVGATLVGAGVVRAADGPPISGAWSITSSGTAETSGELLFRVTGQGRSPVEVTVFVLSGSNETGVASSIRKAFTAQLDNSRYDVAAGEGANVMLTGDASNRGFSVELIDSDIQNIRVMVQSATPVAPPTVPPQQVPANPPATPRTPSAPGDANPPPEEAPPESPPSQPVPATPSAPPAEPSAPPAEPSAPPSQPSAPPAQPSAPPANPSAPPPAPPQGSAPANGGAGASASAPPPPPGT